MKNSFIETKENRIVCLNEKKKHYESKKEELEESIYSKKIEISREKNAYDEIVAKLNNIDLTKLKITSIVQRFFLILAMLVIAAFVINNTIPLILLGVLSIPNINKLSKLLKELKKYDNGELQALKKHINNDLQDLEIEIERTKMELRKIEYKISDIETEEKVLKEIKEYLLSCKKEEKEPEEEKNLVLKRCIKY